MLDTASTPEPFFWMNTISLATLSRGYLTPGAIEAHGGDVKAAAIARVRQMCDKAENVLRNMGMDEAVDGYADKLFDYAGRGWISFASPIWSNFAANRGLPISCNGSFMDDTTESILYKTAEIGMMTKHGAGTSVYMGALRPEGSPISGGGTSRGQVHFMRLVQEHTDVISQSNVRRGNCAAYIDIDSPDVDEFLKIRDTGNALQHISIGLCVSDAWMEAMLAEQKGGEKRRLMARIINKRRATGFPYLVFTDTANEARHPRLKELGERIHASNLCTEIFQPSSPKESFVCDLSSLNLVHFDDWKNTDLVETMVFFLDAVMQEYIDKLDGDLFMRDALRAAKRWRSLGLGTLGYHSALQRKRVAFESDEARKLNDEMHGDITYQSIAASRKMARLIGEAEGMKGTGQRNLVLNAIAPTTSSSIILGQVSQSIEPWEANIFENDNAKGVFTQRNPELEALLEEKGVNTPETWTEILKAGGSVQGLDVLTDEEKTIFKCFGEIDQSEIIKQAAVRQIYIDQGQSLNLKVAPETSMKENVDLIVLAWKSGLKSLYYMKSTNKAQELARKNRIAECQSCEA